MPRPLRSRRNQDSASGESSARRRPVAGNNSAVPSSIRRHLDKDEAFQTLTIDGMRWICPFTARTVDAPFDYKEAAIKYLGQHRPWEKQPKPRTADEMNVVRWKIFLQQNIRSDEKLKFFLGDGRWLNPYSGEWYNKVPMQNGKITDHTIEFIARHLANDPRVQDGQMYPEADLAFTFGEEKRRLAALQKDAGNSSASGRLSTQWPFDDRKPVAGPRQCE